MSNLSPLFFTELASRICNGEHPDPDTWQTLADIPETEVCQMMAGADLIRRHHFGTGVSLCAINNAKSGKCSENYRFCAQSAAYDTEIDTYPLKSEDNLVKAMDEAAGTPLHRYSFVTSGRGLSRNGVKTIAAAAERAKELPQSYCASLGILESDEFKTLKSAGFTRYHHNLETAPSHFDRVCTTHSFGERTATVRAAKAADLSVCSGGIFGIGETMAQVVELALVLKDLDVDAVPVNFLTPVSGTPFMDQPPLSPLACLKIIAIFRYILPDKEIIICGGRMNNLKHLHPLVFAAGASGIMTGSYLTTSGNQMNDDLETIRQLGLTPR